MLLDGGAVALALQEALFQHVLSLYFLQAVVLVFNELLGVFRFSLECVLGLFHLGGRISFRNPALCVLSCLLFSLLLCISLLPLSQEMVFAVCSLRCLFRLLPGFCPLQLSVPLFLGLLFLFSHGLDDLPDLAQLLDVSLSVELADLCLYLFELVAFQLDLLLYREHVLVLQGERWLWAGRRQIGRWHLGWWWN